MSDTIVPYRCQYQCPVDCDPDVATAWPESGLDLVAQYCIRDVVDAGPPRDVDPGDTPPPVCPEDVRAADSQPCDSPGLFCNADGSQEPCSTCPDRDCTVIICEDGAWRLYDVSACDVGPADAGPPDDGDGGYCEVPEFSSDCSQVPYFQCGVAPSCDEDGLITVDWHHHYFCESSPIEEEIATYRCQVQCPAGCDPDVDSAWPQSGAELVADYCLD